MAPLVFLLWQCNRSRMQVSRLSGRNGSQNNIKKKKKTTSTLFLTLIKPIALDAGDVSSYISQVWTGANYADAPLLHKTATHPQVL